MVVQTNAGFQQQASSAYHSAGLFYSDPATALPVHFNDGPFHPPPHNTSGLFYSDPASQPPLPSQPPPSSLGRASSVMMLSPYDLTPRRMWSEDNSSDDENSSFDHHHHHQHRMLGEDERFRTLGEQARVESASQQSSSSSSHSSSVRDYEDGDDDRASSNYSAAQEVEEGKNQFVVNVPCYGQYHADKFTGTHRGRQPPPLPPRTRAFPEEAQTFLSEIHQDFTNYRQRFWGVGDPKIGSGMTPSSSSSASRYTPRTPGSMKMLLPTPREKRDSRYLGDGLVDDSSSSSSSSDDEIYKDGDIEEKTLLIVEKKVPWPMAVATNWAETRAARELEVQQTAELEARRRLEVEYEEQNAILEEARLRVEFDFLEEAVVGMPRKLVERRKVQAETIRLREKNKVIDQGPKAWPTKRIERMMQDLEQKSIDAQMAAIEAKKLARQAKNAVVRKKIPPPKFFQVPGERPIWPIKVAEFEVRGGKTKWPLRPDPSRYKGPMPVPAVTRALGIQPDVQSVIMHAGESKEFLALHGEGENERFGQEAMVNEKG